MKKYLIIVVPIMLIAVIGILLFTRKGDKKEYFYTAEKSGNMINYNLKIENGDNLNGNLYSNDGEWLSELKSGEAIVNEMDIKDFPNFKIKVNDATYVIKYK